MASNPIKKDDIAVKNVADNLVKGLKKGKKEVDKLTKSEQEIYLVLTTLDDKTRQVPLKQLARKTGLSEEIAVSYVTSMIRKGVPIARSLVQKKLCLKLNPVFKKLQAKENILKLSQQPLF